MLEAGDKESMGGMLEIGGGAVRGYFSIRAITDRTDKITTGKRSRN